MVDIGTLPEWIAVGFSAVAYNSARRNERARDWGNEVSALSNMDSQQIQDAITENDSLFEIIERGLQSASATSSEDKRRLLARVAASALTGDGLAQPDEYNYLLQTIDRIEVPDLQVLVQVAHPTAGKVQNDTGFQSDITTVDGLIRDWEGIATLCVPIVARLESEGLIDAVDMVATTQRGFHCSRYGATLLRFLDDGKLTDLDLDNARIAVSHQHMIGASPVTIENTGLATAKEVHLILQDGTDIPRGRIWPYASDVHVLSCNGDEFCSASNAIVTWVDTSLRTITLDNRGRGAGASAQ